MQNKKRKVTRVSEQGSVPQIMQQTIATHALIEEGNPLVAMISGGSDSTALAYLMHTLFSQYRKGDLAFVHVNHHLRGKDSDADAAFVCTLAKQLQIPLFSFDVDVATLAEHTNGNVEALARTERYRVAYQALATLCEHASVPLERGRMVTAHTLDDRVENFYMRSIVGTGPGGFRSMRYRSALVIRPLLDVDRAALRTYIMHREQRGFASVHTNEGALWCEDETNTHTDRFRAYVRHEIIPRAKQRNPQLLRVLMRTMNLIGEEDDMLEALVDKAMDGMVVPVSSPTAKITKLSDNRLVEGYLINPTLDAQPLALKRRVVVRVLHNLLGYDIRFEAAAVEAVLNAWHEGRPRSGYVVNITGNLAVSANKYGVRIEPMQVFRARRGKV